MTTLKIRTTHNANLTNSEGKVKFGGSYFLRDCGYLYLIVWENTQYGGFLYGYFL